MASPSQIKYKEEYVTQVIEMACQGKSMVQIAAAWKVCKGTILAWSKDTNKPEFMEAYKVARTCNEAYWEDVGQKGAKGTLTKFNPIAWNKIMAARFKDDWVDNSTQKIELKNEIKAMTTQEIDSMIKTLLAQRKNNKKADDDSDAGDTKDSD